MNSGLRLYESFPGFIRKLRGLFGGLRDLFYFCGVKKNYGGLAQLARALAWHARGRRFDPDTLHSRVLKVCKVHKVYERKCSL